MTENRSDSKEYQGKKAFFDGILTLYGRKPVLEALQADLPCYRLHLANSNKPAAILAEITALAEQQGSEILYHDKAQLSRISRNGKQDQGVAADIQCPRMRNIDNFLESLDGAEPQRILAIDGITNPQNLGMIIRSATAGNINGILLPDQGSATLGPLTVKASAGTIFKAPIIRCRKLGEALLSYKKAGFIIASLSAEANESIFNYQSATSTIYVLGNETHGVSKQTASVSDITLSIPMANHVESLNVAMAATLIAYASQIQASQKRIKG